MVGGGTARAQDRLTGAARPEQDAPDARASKSERTALLFANVASRQGATDLALLCSRSCAKAACASCKTARPTCASWARGFSSTAPRPTWSSSAAGRHPQCRCRRPGRSRAAAWHPAARHGQRPRPHARDPEQSDRGEPGDRRGPNPPDRPRAHQRQAFFQRRQRRPERTCRPSARCRRQASLGVLGYPLTLWRALGHRHSFRAEIRCNGTRARVRTMQISVGNGRYYGGGMTDRRRRRDRRRHARRGQLRAAGRARADPQSAGAALGLAPSVPSRSGIGAAARSKSGPFSRCRSTPTAR